MKKVIGFALAMALSASALANTVESQHTATVEMANCVQVGQNESMVGGLVGGALGSVGGAVVGSMFGKSGKTIGGLVGGLGGAAYGASGDKIYNCSVMAALNDGNKIMVSKQTTQPIQQGSSIGVVKLTNGQWGAL